jgi:cell division protein FtsZ
MALDALKFVIQEEEAPKTQIRVFGVGGGGSNAVARMLDGGLTGVEFCVLNTDAQALAASPVPKKLSIGSKITHGLGAGSDPEVGRQAALEDTEKIIELLEGADMVFVTAGLGGGTGTGAAPVVAALAKELGALTVAVVTKPFAFEGSKRRKQAEQGLAELAGVVDTVITIPNDQLLALVPKKTSIFESFRIADDVLRQAVEGIANIITTPGLINRDFSDIRAIMVGMGYAMMGTATAKGDDALMTAAEQAISSPLLEAGGVRGARGVLINITGSSRLGLHEVNDACELIRKAAENDDVQINFGVVMDEAMGDEVKITVIATGFERESLPSIRRTALKASAAAVGSSMLPSQDAIPTREIPRMEQPPVTAMPVAEPMFEEYEDEVLAQQPEVEEVRAAEPQPPPLTRAAVASAQPAPPAPNGTMEPPMDELDVPAILRRRMM